MKENVKMFLEELDQNEKAQEMLKAVAADGAEPDIAAMAKAARETGYDVTEDEMQAFLAQIEKHTAKASDAVAEKLIELTSDEMELVAGGKVRDACRDTYAPGENCLLNDACHKWFQYYSTAEDKEKICDGQFYCAKALMKPGCEFGRIGLW